MRAVCAQKHTDLKAGGPPLPLQPYEAIGSKKKPNGNPGKGGNYITQMRDFWGVCRVRKEIN
jgi:hypothetical protein